MEADIANFRRRRPRYLTGANHESTSYWRKHFGLKPVKITKRIGVCNYVVEYQEYLKYRADKPHNTYRKSPSVWNRVYHNKPTRIRTRQIMKAVQIGSADPENICWPSHKKPTIYYW